MYNATIWKAYIKWIKKFEDLYLLRKKKQNNILHTCCL